MRGGCTGKQWSVRMGLFSFFQRRDPEEIISDVAQVVVTVAIESRGHLLDAKNPRSARASCEVVYALLHVVDRSLFRKVGADKRNAYFDAITTRAITMYVVAVLKPKLPNYEPATLGKLMLEGLNNRQEVFANCTSIAGEGTPSRFPTQGSVVFAMCYFIRKELGDKMATPAKPLLAGKADISQTPLEELPSVEQLVKAAALVGAAVGEIGKILRKA